jgi:hypothetical protein
MNPSEVRKFLTERKRKLDAASCTLGNQIAILEKGIQQRARLREELDALISKYWPDEPVGRPSIWKGYDLVVLVEGRDPNCTIKDAIEHLHKIKCPPCDRHPIESLRSRYHVAKNHWWPAIKRIREIEAEHDALNAATKECEPPMTFDEIRNLVNPQKAGLSHDD